MDLGLRAKKEDSHCHRETQCYDSTKINPNVAQKITNHAGKRRKQSASADKSETLPERSGPTTGLFQDKSTNDQPSNSMKLTSRYTISARTRPPVDVQAATTASQSTESTESMVSRSTPVSEGPSNRIRKPDYATPVADFAAHRGETGTITPSVIGNDFRSRLEGLQQFKAWSERLHESALQHEEKVKRAKAAAAQLIAEDDGHSSVAAVAKKPVEVASSKTRPQLANGISELDDSTFTASTSFSTPQVAPVSVGATTSTRGEGYPALATSTPSFNLPAKAESSSKNATRSRSNSRSIVISSMPTKELEQRARSRSLSLSRSGTQAPVVPVPKAREKKHPPISFPKNFYDHQVEEASAPPSEADRSRQTASPKRSIPSKSQHTSSLTGAEHGATKSQEPAPKPAAKPVDQQGRPTFYTTIHYYTECEHASPPATRPLDPDAQPRPDPDLHIFNLAVSRSIIPGSCFNCDTTRHREDEYEVIKAYTAQVSVLKDELASLIEQLEIDDPIDSGSGAEDMHDQHGARLATPTSFPEDALEDDLRSLSSLPPLSDDPSESVSSHGKMSRTSTQRSFAAQIILQIRQLEARVDEVRDAQDDEIRRVWRGYTRRWGPATLGVQRGGWSTNIDRYLTREDTEAILEQQERSIEVRLNMPDEIGPELTDSDLNDDMQVVTAPGIGIEAEDARLDDEGVRTSSTGESSARGREISRTVSPSDNNPSTPSERSRKSSRPPTHRISTPATPKSTLHSDRASIMSRDLPGSRTPGEGKMRVGWVRDGV